VARVDVIMPQMGESIAEGTVSRWLKKVGDAVKRDEALFEISTDKVDAEIPSPSAGILAEIIVGEGKTVEINTVVARLETDASVPLGAVPAAPALRPVLLRPVPPVPPLRQPGWSRQPRLPHPSHRPSARSKIAYAPSRHHSFAKLPPNTVWKLARCPAAALPVA